MLLFSLIADTEVVALAFILIAWRYRERRWVSAIALGLGCAFRQYCWFFAPFLLLDALLSGAPALAPAVSLAGAGLRERALAAAQGLRAGAWREAVSRALITLGAFLVPDLPYIIASPAEWWTSLWLPVTAPLFPLGVGLVALAKGHLLPYAPSALYTTLEIIALWRASGRSGAGASSCAKPFHFWRCCHSSSPGARCPTISPSRRCWRSSPSAH